MARKKANGNSGAEAPQGARRATEGASAPRGLERGRYSSARKADAVIRLLRGEDLDTVSREYGVAAATLSQWRDEFVEAGRVGLKTRQNTPQDDEVARLKMLIGKLTIDRECLEEIVRVHEARAPFVQRRSKP